MKFSGVYYIFTAPILPLSTFTVDEVVSLSAAGHILRNIYTPKKLQIKSHRHSHSYPRI